MAPRRKIRFQPRDLLFLLVALVVGYLTIVPLVMLVYGSFKSSPPGVPGPFTLEHYRALFQRPEMLGSLKNSLVFGLGSSLLAFTGGAFLAWGGGRANHPLKKKIFRPPPVPLTLPRPP